MASSPARVRALEDVATKRLRCLDADELFSNERFGDDRDVALLGDALDGVGEREAGDGGVRAARDRRRPLLQTAPGWRTGRAASCTMTMSASSQRASPQRTDAARDEPPVTTSPRLRRAVVAFGHDEHDVVGGAAARGDAARGDGLAVNEGELLGTTKTGAPARGHHHGRDRHAYGRTEASFSSAASVSTLRAKVSSETRIWRARVSMRFSPALSPLSLSRIDRFRTTSATW